MPTGPLLFTKIGALFGVAAVVIWIATFSAHGGVELSGILFPLWRLAAGVLLPGRSIPVLAWYAGALLHWPALGAAIDLARALRRGSRRVGSPPNSSMQATSREETNRES